MDEFQLIENIKSWIEDQEMIGDDAAILPNNTLACVDTLVEDVHFTRKITSFYELGWKALAVNISDIAAMGGRSKYALISFAVTDDIISSDLKQFYYGFKELAKLAGVVLIGGDTVKSKTKIVVTITLLGEVISEPILRKGANLGDYLCLTGVCGEASKGLQELLKIGKTTSLRHKKFNKPMPRFKEGIIIGENRIANSMVDISDGLAFSLYELIKDMNLGISLNQEFDSDALYGGEDYELLFTVSDLNKLQKLKNSHVNIIGKITNENCGVVNMHCKNGQVEALENKGYSAFSSCRD
ncbi:MAG: thiamine-phosphate kinase [bacterium]|nr:thiamine-phosphate kinase [bacterium]